MLAGLDATMWPVFRSGAAFSVVIGNAGSTTTLVQQAMVATAAGNGAATPCLSWHPPRDQRDRQPDERDR